MKRKANRVRARVPALLGWLFAAALASGTLQAETAYISDMLTVPVRSGPSTGHRILHRGIPSGTQLEILERDEASGFVRIRTRGGTEGWLEEQYLVSEPIARQRLDATSRELERVSSTVSELRSELQTVRQDKGEVEQTSETLEAQVNRLQAELAELRRVSSGALETEAANQRLTELNARLREELDQMVAELDRLRDDAQQRWLMIGGGLVLLGLVLGVGIKSRPRRSAWT